MKNIISEIISRVKAFCKTYSKHIITVLAIMAALIILLSFKELLIIFIILGVLAYYLMSKYMEVLNANKQKEDAHSLNTSKKIQIVIYNWLKEYASIYKLHNYRSSELIKCTCEISNGMFEYKYVIMKSTLSSDSNTDEMQILKLSLQDHLNRWADSNNIQPIDENTRRHNVLKVDDCGASICVTIIEPLAGFDYLVKPTKTDTVFSNTVLSKTTITPESDNITDLFLKKTMLDLGVKSAIPWYYTKNPHMLIFGSPGRGKTYLVKKIIAEVECSTSEPSVTVCDFKADDFDYLEGCKNYYSYDNCFNGLKNFYAAFKERQTHTDNTRTFKLLIFDEWASFLNTLDKKAADEAKSILSTLLMLGRSFNVHVIISQQRADAEYFSKARDNFSMIVAMGNISKESVQMFFNDFADMISKTDTIGQGHLLINGSDYHEIIVPEIEDYDNMINLSRSCVDS